MELIVNVKDWFSLHKGYELTLKPGYTALVGPNGAGKTTLLSQLADYAKANNITLWEYSNLRDGGQAATARYTSYGDIEKMATSMTASEGENVAFNFGNSVARLGRAVRRAAEEKVPLLVLLDAIDSGASIDRARDLMKFFKSMTNDAIRSKVDVFLVVAVNHYELVRDGVDCVNVRTGEHVTFDSYDKYADFICTFEDAFKRVPQKPIQRGKPTGRKANHGKKVKKDP